MSGLQSVGTDDCAGTPMSKRFLALLILAAAMMTTASLCLAGPVVTTAAGAVSGTTEGATNEWRGIPYAAPPTGTLRWRAPQAATPWVGVRDATTFALPCIQLDSPVATHGSEDCLYLNVFAPIGATSSSRLPVMVHLHGGGNAFGAPYQDASAFTSHGVIVVTPAYRLGIMGFAGHPALSVEDGVASGEYGLQDQIAALQWVHDNIAAFGGDPENVTLFGLSAGSFDTVALMLSPLSRALIAKAAVQGEAYWSLTGTYSTIADAEQLGISVSAAVGCAEAASEVACLRALPAEVLVLAAGYLDLSTWTGGRVLPASPLDLVARQPGIPLLVGFDREENATLAWPYLAEPFQTRNWVHASELLVTPPNAAQARSLYPAAQYASRKWAYITMETDFVRGCSTRLLANANAATAPTYRYLYTHAYENDPGLAQFRASHAFEEPFIWGNFDLFPGFIFGYQPSAAEQILSQRMTGYWTNFARTGDPNGPGLPSWSAYNAASEPIVVLDTTVSSVYSYHAQECAFLDGLGVAPFSFGADYYGRKLGLFDSVP